MMLNATIVHRLLSSLIAHELNTKKPSLYGALSIQDIHPRTRLREQDLALDSLSLTRLAIAVASYFGLYHLNRQEYLLAGQYVEQWTQEILQAQDLGADGLHFMTSGSTGISKSVHHPSLFLEQEVQAWCHKIKMLNIRRVVVACPLHHIYGCIWGVLLPTALDVPMISVTPARLPNWLMPHDMLVTVPPVWEYLAPASANLPAHLLGINSTGHLPTLTRELLAQADIQLWEIYGSSETAGIAARNVKDQLYETLSYWSRGKQMHQIERVCPDGQTRLYELQDVVSWQDDRMMQPLKRRDEAIQIGGINVSAQWVSNQIELMPGVKECSVRAEIQGADSYLKAFIVLDQDTEIHRHDMAFMIRMQLPQQAMPKHLTFGDQLPINSMGKLMDWQIA
jgi:long-chain acyl-CoA synthetase